ncbi:hypothetical protein E3E31_08890 [Thermococcus sp. M39]|uniref:hypothetical protein n=1 Tax=Thermococcus sp. M39 TaxID=1638262 RepID=UPI00143BA308|nr:hypothetical protein [Thermococcus sp. M39]NJE08633.1 hypothetical protein [Thermococcus sp. M39]
MIFYDAYFGRSFDKLKQNEFVNTLNTKGTSVPKPSKNPPKDGAGIEISVDTALIVPKAEAFISLKYLSISKGKAAKPTIPKDFHAK